MTKADLIYKIASRPLWQKAESEGRFLGAPVDLADGFIHFSTVAQVRETAKRHFSGVTDLLVIAVDPDRLGQTLTWEPSRGGQLFPHLYGPLPLDAVLFVEDLPTDADGVHVFPSRIP